MSVNNESMKKNILIILITIVAFNGYAQRKIKKTVVEEVGFKIKLNFKTETNELVYNDLKLKITPVSTSSLNEKFLSESEINGEFEYSNYEKSRSSFFLKKRKKKLKKTEFEFLLEGVDWLLQNENINNEEYKYLFQKVVLKYDYTREKEFIDSQKIILCNPYYIGGKYLNVFELEINNETNSYQKYDKKLLIEAGQLLLQPMSYQKIIEVLKKGNLLNQEKIETLNRYNLPNELIIPPHSKFIKYFATVPVQYNNNDELKISFEGLNSKFKWIIDVEHDLIDEKYSFFELSTSWSYDNLNSNLGVNFCKLNATSNIFYVNGDVYINENNLDDEFEVISISLLSDKLYFSRLKFIGRDYIQLDKNKRKGILLKTIKIEDLDKKIKQ